MISEVTLLSLAEIKQMPPSGSTIVISILDYAQRPDGPTLDGCRDVLFLDFFDVQEDNTYSTPWPDAMTPEEHALATMDQRGRAPELVDAERIVDFVAGHHRPKETLRLIAHCQAGISRSAAVALWTHQYFGIPIVAPHNRDTDGANKRVLRLLGRASDSVMLDKLDGLKARLGVGVIVAIRDCLVDLIRPSKIIIFGSYARGDANEGSDIDICAVVSDDQPRDHDARVRCRRVLEGPVHGAGLPFDLVLLAEAAFDQEKVKPDSLEHTIDSEGVVIYELR